MWKICISSATHKYKHKTRVFILQIFRMKRIHFKTKISIFHFDKHCVTKILTSCHFRNNLHQKELHLWMEDFYACAQSLFPLWLACLRITPINQCVWLLKREKEKKKKDGKVETVKLLIRWGGDIDGSLGSVVVFF